MKLSYDEHFERRIPMKTIIPPTFSDDSQNCRHEGDDGLVFFEVIALDVSISGKVN